MLDPKAIREVVDEIYEGIQDGHLEVIEGELHDSDTFRSDWGCCTVRCPDCSQQFTLGLDHWRGGSFEVGDLP